MLLRAHTWVRVAVGDFRSHMHDRFTDLVGSETGATAAEYALLVALIAVVIIAGATVLGTSIDTKLNDTGTKIGTAGT